MSDITEIAKRYRFLESEAKKQADSLKKVNADWTDCENELLEALVEAGQKSVEVEGVGRFTMANRVFISYNTENKEKVMEYLREIGSEDLIKEDIMKAAFGDWIDPHFDELKIQFESQGFDLVDARKKALEHLASKGFSEFTKRTLQVRKA